MDAIVKKEEMERRSSHKNEYSTPLSVAIMNLYVQNLTGPQIAERLGHSRQYVSSIIKAPNFQHQLSIRRATIADGIDDKVINAEMEAANVLKAHAKETAEKMVELLEDESSGIQLRAAADILDRVGPQKRQKNAEASVAIVMIDGDAARLIKETAEMIQV